MATVYLHIGLPKTGTTAVQHFLTDNDEALKNHGICFPDFGLKYPGIGYRRNARFLVAAYTDDTGKKDKKRPCQEYDATLDRIAELAKSYDKILLSDEAIWIDSQNRSDFWPKLKEDFDKRGLPLRIIVYLRRQDAYMQSLYCQKIKAAKTMVHFSDYLQLMQEKNYPLDFSSRIDMLAEIFGKENLIIRVYEKAQYKGEEQNIFSDFLDIFGLSLKDGFEVRQAMHNITLDGNYLEINRILNGLPVPPRDVRTLKNSISEVQATSPFTKSSEKQTLFKPEEQAAFLEQFAVSNSHVARNYLGRDDGILFYEEVKDLPEYQIDTDELLRDVIMVYGRAVELLEQENQKLQNDLQKVRKDMQTLRSDFKAVRENVLLFRLKRKLRHIMGKD